MTIRRILSGLLALAVLLAPLALSEYYVTLINYVGLSAMVALGLVLLTGIGGLTSFGQAAFVGVGAYATAVATTAFGLSPWMGLSLGLVLTGVVALGLGLVTLRLAGHYLPLGTIAWGMSLYFLFGNIELFGGHNGLTGLPPVTLGGFVLDRARDFTWIIWGLLLAAIWALTNLLDSRPGRAIRALRGGTVMAESCGVDTARLKVAIFVLAALLASLSGWLYAHLLRFVNPTPFGINAGIEYLFMAVIGGAGQVWGAVIGAGVLTLLKERLQDLLPRLLGSNGNFEIVVFGLAMVLLLQRARGGIAPFVTRLLPAVPPTVVPQAAPDLPRRARPARGTALLQVEGATKRFGGLTAVNGVSFTLGTGEIVGLIGPNGAGKSTLFNLITGVLAVDDGAITFQGRRLDRLPSRAIARAGIARSFQHVHLRPAMSVLENVAIGAHLRGKGSILSALVRAERREEGALLAEAVRQIDRVGLGAHLNDPAGSLALGQQRIVEIARALAADPVLLLLDEPAAGLRYAEKQALAALLRQLRAEGMSVLIVEHDMDFVMNLVDRLVVMDFGQKIAEGSPRDVRGSRAVQEAYLGAVA